MKLNYALSFLILAACAYKDSSTQETDSTMIATQLEDFLQPSDTLAILEQIHQPEYFYSNGKKIIVQGYGEMMGMVFTGRIDTTAANMYLAPMGKTLSKGWYSQYPREVQRYMADIGARKIDSLQKSGIILVPNILASTTSEHEFIEAYNRSLEERSISLELADLEKTFWVEGENELLVATGRIIGKMKDLSFINQLRELSSELGFRFELDSTSTRNKIIIHPNNSDDLMRISGKLYESDLFEYVVPDTKVFIEDRSLNVAPDNLTNDRHIKEQWYLENLGVLGGVKGSDIKFRYAREERVFGDASISIAIIDGGINFKHEDLIDNYLPGSGRNYWDEDPKLLNDPLPRESTDVHGTRVTGIAVAKADNSKGIAGVCPSCTFIPIKAVKKGSLSNASVDKLAKAFDYAIKSGASIITNSYGFKIRVGMEDLLDAIKLAATKGRNQRGCVIIFGAPNDPIDFCKSDDIAAYRYVISVSGVSNKDSLSKHGYGGCLKVLAPSDGGSIKIATTDYSASANNRYTFSFGGTSASAPMVAGACGLVLSLEKNITAEEVGKLIAGSCDKINPTKAMYDKSGHSKAYGYGRINLERLIVNAKKLIAEKYDSSSQ